ncbi:hypothetical protein TELCIR_14664, partial [Teladorsagia circumcincta]
SPDYFVPPSGFSRPLEEQLDQVIQWLDMPSSTRPGLILVSNDDIIRTLRIDTSDKTTLKNFFDMYRRLTKTCYEYLRGSRPLRDGTTAVRRRLPMCSWSPKAELNSVGVLDHLNTYTLALSKELGRVICITGTAYDRDFDGIADANRTRLHRPKKARNLPHWTGIDLDTERADEIPLPTVVPSLPEQSSIFDILGQIGASGELLLQYTARLRDVELISGIEFELPMTCPHPAKNGNM